MKNKLLTNGICFLIGFLVTILAVLYSGHRRHEFADQFQFTVRAACDAGVKQALYGNEMPQQLRQGYLACQDYSQTWHDTHY